MSTPHGRRSLASHAKGDEGERGSSLLGILSVVGILGILAVIALTLNFGSSPGPVATTLPGASPTSTTTTGPQDIASEQQVADRAACQANFAEINVAVSDYRALNGPNPPAGTAWATSSTGGGPFLQSWPSLTGAFTFTWNGSVVSVVPDKGAASHGTVGTASPASGCFA